MTPSADSPEDPVPRRRPALHAVDGDREARREARRRRQDAGDDTTEADTADNPGPGPAPEAAGAAAETPAQADPAPGSAAAKRRNANRRRRQRRRRAAAAAAGGAAAAAAAAPGAPATAPDAPAAAVSAQSVAPARMRVRHWGILASFLLMVALPFAAVAAYLYTRAADQYHSEVAFSIRSEEAASATAGLIGALTQVGSGTASDADILYEFIRSQRIVEAIDSELDLRAIYNAAEGDPVFTLGADAPIEALVAHWLRMVAVDYDSAAGIIHVTARAFSPGDARAIATEILAESDALVNQLSEQAREDAVRFAREELEEAEEVLRGVRKDLADFRRQYNLVDPTADVAGQMGLLNALQQELAQALVDRDVLLSYAAESDQRVVQANRRITAITERIEEERSSLDLTGLPGSLPDVVGRYEELLVNLEFANTAFTQTLAGLGAARAEARRQSRYLAPHIQPTLATTPLYPRRAVLTGLAGLFLLLGWGMLLLIYYNVRDNR